MFGVDHHSVHTLYCSADSIRWHDESVLMKGTRGFRHRTRAPGTRSAQGTSKPRCAQMPSSAKQLQERVHICASALDAPLRGMARKYSPPVLIVALALQLNRLGRAHVSAGLLTTDDLRELVMETCDFASPAPPDSMSAVRKSRNGGQTRAPFRVVRGPTDRGSRQNTRTPSRHRSGRG